MILSEAQFLGMLIVALGSLLGLFTVVYKPLTENTKAMTTLGIKIEHLSEKIEEDRKEHEKHLKDFEEYKEHVSKSQKEQWDAIRENKSKLGEHNKDIEHLKKCENYEIGGHVHENV